MKLLCELFGIFGKTVSKKLIPSAVIGGMVWVCFDNRQIPVIVVSTFIVTRKLFMSAERRKISI